MYYPGNSVHERGCSRINTYLVGLITVSSAVGVCSYLSPGAEWNKTIKITASIVLLCTVISPLISLIRDIDFSFSHTDSELDISIEDSKLYESVEEAFSQGVKKYICETFSISESDVLILVSGFDAVGMRAEKIKVVLYGSAALADNRSICEKIESAGLGECEVMIGVK